MSAGHDAPPDGGRPDRRWLWFGLRALIFVGAVAFVLSQVEIADRVIVDAAGAERIEPGLASRLAGADLAWVGLAFLSFSCFTITGIIRWWMLLRVQGFPISLWRATRLSLIGLFFNNVIPGVTGGDVVKAVAIARAVPQQGTRAVTTVALDRLLGLIALIALGASVAVFQIATPAYRSAALLLLSILVVAVVVAIPLLIRSVRRVLRLDALLRRLPFQSTLLEIDAAVLAYREHPRAIIGIFAFSVFGQIFGVTDAWCMARAVGVDVPLAALLVVIPVIQVFSIIPISPGGWGVGEGLYAYFFRFVGIVPATSVAISVGTRLIYTVHCLIGGLFLLSAGAEVHDANVEASGVR